MTHLRICNTYGYNTIITLCHNPQKYFYQITFQRYIFEVKSIKSEMASVLLCLQLATLFLSTEDQFAVFVWFVCFSGFLYNFGVLTSCFVLQPYNHPYCYSGHTRIKLKIKRAITNFWHTCS